MKTQLSAVAAILLLGAASAAAQTQHPEAANAPKFGIAVVDVGFIFKQHQGFNTAMQQMKGDAERMVEQLKSQAQQLAQQQEGLQRLQPNTPDYQDLDNKLTEGKMKLGLEEKRIKTDLSQREAKIYFQTYQQVSYAVANYARQNNIGLVLRFNGDQPDPNVPREVLQGINKPVVFENNIDITRDILAIVNGNPAANVGRAPNTARTR